MANHKSKKRVFDIQVPEKKEDLIARSVDQLEYPIFSFKYLQEDSIKDCKDHNFFYSFLIRMKNLSELGWAEIRKSHKHSFGMSKIPISALKPQMPKAITPDVTELTVFRAVGDNRPFLGFQTGGIFHVVFIESTLNEIYHH